MIYGGPPSSSTYSSFPQPYGQQPASFQPQPSSFPHQSSTFAPPGVTQFPNPQPFAPPQQFQPPPGQAFPPPYQSAPPQPYSSSSSIPFQSNQYQAPRTEAPPQLPMRPGSLPPAPGLPQRPSFGAPPVNAFQMQQLHQGQIPGPSNPHDVPVNHQPGVSAPPGRPPGSHSNGSFEGPSVGQTPHQVSRSSEAQGVLSAGATSLDDLLSGAAKEADKADMKQDEPQEEKKTAKKEKEKSTRLVYSDNDTSPEEKMAQMPRYAFVPNGKEESLSAGAVVADITVSTSPEG